MISLDWKERLKKDAEDFYLNKLPRGDYDIDIIYNAYPERINGKVSPEVVTYVAGILAPLCAKKPLDYVSFYNYLWENKVDNGKLAFCIILGRVIKKETDYFLNYTETFLYKYPAESYQILEKVIYPLLKKNTQQHLKHVYGWLEKGTDELKQNIIKILIKLAKSDPELAKTVFKRLENGWLNADETLQKASISFLKALWAIDAEHYLSIYKSYALSREPVFAEILTQAIKTNSKEIEEMVTRWSQSGNVRLKKAGMNGLKTLKRYS